ncbi:Hsp90 cochaperone [Coemansia interrupta]|uniref:Hsp90 cochaperone n=1 Tax=Coemansia interrupta TaxID=1126814 RepID=A0A9W8HB96_9FUNG|nr:Hsp90 cochaperone [Coemansia interrupta]
MATANDLKTQGNAAFAAGNHDEAIKLFTQAIELDPTNHVLYSNRSASLASLKKYEDALADAEKTVELKPDWPKGYSRKGAALFGLQRLAEAKDTYEAGLKYDPENALLKKGLNDADTQLKSAERAEDDIGKQFANAFKGDVLGKIAANPKTAPFLADPAFVSKIRTIQENPEKLSEFANDQRVTMVMFTLMGLGDVFTQNPEDIPGMSEPYSPPETSSPKPAQKKEESSTKMEVDEPVESADLTEEEKEAAAKKKQAADAKNLGNNAYKARQFEEALEHYSKAIELDQTDITFWNNKAAVYFEMGKYEECIETAQQAVETGREYRAEYKHIAKALGRIGTAYSKLDNIPKAIEYYNRSLTEHRSADILTKLRTLEKLQKQREEESYRDADKSNEARERGNEFFKAADYAKAQTEYSEAIKRNPDDPRNYSNRAACLTKLMAIPDAIKDCETCIKLDPTFIKAYIRKANALFLMREYAEALDALEEAKAQDKDKKNSGEIDQIEYKCYSAINEQNSRLTPEEALKRAQENPKIAALLGNPVMQNILQQMQSDPRAAREHLKNPSVASNLRKLIAAGIVRMG